ncbi:MAG: hypothetical protein ABIP44_07400 [Pseudoxanthomonas sp.]
MNRMCVAATLVCVALLPFAPVAAQEPPRRASSYAQILSSPQSPVAAATAAVAVPTDEERLALEAARQDADAKRALLEKGRAAGVIDATEYRSQVGDYKAAVGAYATLSNRDGPAMTHREQSELKQQLLQFNAAKVGLVSPMTRVALHRGARGEVRVESASLEASVDQSIEELKASLPPGQDPRPALAYLASLRHRTLGDIRAARVYSDTLGFPQATLVVQPLQEAQMMTMSGPGWMLRLSLVSDPVDANVVFSTRDGYRSEFTTNTSRDLMRGLLDYKVSLQGYKPITGPLNLVTAAKGIFRCKLVPENSAIAARACNIQ